MVLIVQLLWLRFIGHRIIRNDVTVLLLRFLPGSLGHMATRISEGINNRVGEFEWCQKMAN